jgi:hypothetical protein
VISPTDFTSALKAITHGTNDLDSALEKVMAFLDKISSTISDERLSAPQVTETCEAWKNLLAAVENLLDAVHDHRARYVAEIYGELCEMFEQKLPVERTYNPADLERVMKVEAMIDTRVEKALARIAGIKEFRRLYGQKQVASGSA